MAHRLACITQDELMADPAARLQHPPPEEQLLAPLSSLVAQSFVTTEALVQTVLALISTYLGLRTSFLTEIHVRANRNHILAAHNGVGGCDLPAGVDLPLHETFCSIITSVEPPKPLVIHDVRYDALFGQHPAALASPHIGCFVGVPIVLRNGHVFGTLCAIDPEAHSVSPQQTDLLLVLARFVATQLDHDHEQALRDRLEAERDQLLATTREALREREALLAIASHELKNPLAALLGQAQLLQRHLLRAEAITERDHERIAIIVTQGQRLNTMLTELLDVSQLDTGVMTLARTPVDMYTIVQQVLDAMYTLYPHHTIELVEPASPVLVNGDMLRLEQVVRNLLSNAIKYTERGGFITITIAHDSPFALLSVSDTGIGIPSEALPQLFRRFYRAKQEHAPDVMGFGIGLYVVKEIVTRHGGAITVESTEGVGSTFTVRLPLLESR
jgi:signal transduction histidine kinase